VCRTNERRPPRGKRSELKRTDWSGLILWFFLFFSPEKNTGEFSFGTCSGFGVSEDAMLGLRHPLEKSARRFFPTRSRHFPFFPFSTSLWTHLSHGEMIFIIWIGPHNIIKCMCHNFRFDKLKTCSLLRNRNVLKLLCLTACIINYN